MSSLPDERKMKNYYEKKSLVLQYFQVLPVKAFTVFPTVPRVTFNVLTFPVS